MKTTKQRRRTRICREKINYKGYLVYKRKDQDWWDIPYPWAGREQSMSISRLPNGQLVLVHGDLEYISSFEEGMEKILAMQWMRPYTFR